MDWRLSDWRARWRQAVEDESIRPDLGRAVRSFVGVMVPLGLSVAGWLPLEAAFVVIAAQGMTLLDVRGAYPVRFAFLVAMVLILAGTTFLGTLAAGHVWSAVAATAVVAVNAGLWRHLTPEYGPALATPAGLLFFVAVLSPAGDHALAALVGGLWGLVVQVAMWPIRYEHPLRRAVAESWLAAGQLFAACEPGGEGRQERIVERETALRGALDSGYEALAGAKGVKARRGNVERLERLHVGAARLATDVGALNTAMEPLVAAGRAATGEEQAWQAAADSLGNTARAVAVAVVSRQPAHLAVAEVRMRRATSLLQSLQGRAGADPVVGGIVGQVETHLAEAGEALRSTVARAGERAIFPLELLDLNTWRLRPMTAVLNLSTRPNPAVVRYTMRSATVTMLAVLASKLWPMPHGYWLPYTVLVVLQADYGATRLRAVQRLTGTLLGSVLGSLLLLPQLPLWTILAAVGMTGSLFAFFMRRNYAVAVVFITLFVVVVTEARQPVTIALTLERLGITVAGGVLAMAAAMVFWPTWERERFPTLLAGAIRANRDYLGIIAERIERGTGEREVRMAGKRAAERANREVFGSLGRLFADPASRREGAERMAVLANGNQRLTRVLNVIAVGLDSGQSDPEAAAYARQLMAVLTETADTVQQWGTSHAGGKPAGDPAMPTARGWITEQMLRAGTEVTAMRTAAGGPFGAETRR